MWVARLRHFYYRSCTKSYTVIKLPRSIFSYYCCFLLSSVRGSSKELAQFLLKGITDSEESINTTVFPAEHFYIVLDKDEDAFPVNLVMKKTAQRAQFNYSDITRHLGSLLDCQLLKEFKKWFYRKKKGKAYFFFVYGGFCYGSLDVYVERKVCQYFKTGKKKD